MHIFSKTTKAVALILAAAATSGLTACNDSFIFDYEGDCDPKYRVRFTYDWNMKFADAFSNEVDHVTLNVIDPDGNIVHTHIETGDALSSDGYEVVLDEAVKPGKYRLHAWCGRGAEPGNTSFAIHEATQLEHLRCTLLPDQASRTDIEGAEGTDVHRQLSHLYHGLTTEIEFPEDEGTHYFTVPLKKNTNSVKVVLQHLSGAAIDGNDFDFTITASNARMSHDNELIDSDPVTYHAWDITNGSAVIDSEYPGGSGVFSAAVAEFTIARLVKGDDVRMEAHRKSDGKLVFSVPMIDLALMVKGQANRPMDDQEYLDRQDDYNFVFFLDEDYNWINSFLYINSWKIVFQNSEI